MASVRQAKKAGMHLMATMFPDPLEYCSRLLRLNYAHPVWWQAYKLSPPKDVYRIHKLHNVKLPVDRLVRRTFERIPMLRKEKYEFNNADYMPLAVRIALTQQRLVDEDALTEEDAFVKCEHEIFKEELYYFAKTIRDQPGNYFRLTEKEMNHFHLHDIINEVAVVEEGIEKGKSPTDSAMDHLTAEPLTLNKVLEERKVQFKDYEADLGHYGRDGYVFTVPREPVYTDMPMYDADAAIARTHVTGYHESQRFLKSHVQVPASVLLRSLKFTDDYLDSKDIDDDLTWHPDMLKLETHDDEAPNGLHAVSGDAQYFQTHEVLSNVLQIDKLNEEDRRILALLDGGEVAPNAEQNATL